MRAVGFAADLAACLALRDTRARENAAARSRAIANMELRVVLSESASRRGQPDIDWREYFQNAGINYP